MWPRGGRERLRYTLYLKRVHFDCLERMDDQIDVNVRYSVTVGIGDGNEDDDGRLRGGRELNHRC